MDGVRLFFDLVVAFGITFTLVSSTIMSRPRSWITNQFFKDLISCYFCTGFWVSLLVGSVSALIWETQQTLVLSSSATTAQYVTYILEFGFFGAAFCYIIDTFLKYLESV